MQDLRFSEAEVDEEEKKEAAKNAKSRNNHKASLGCVIKCENVKA